ncbi:MAG: divalent-cation tolerance protein CutA [bacterium]|nr:divalent-cation tolerance protein CutA [bacterium]
MIVLTTAGSAESASLLARGLVERRLAACVNIVDSIRSIYRWQGEIADENELLLVIKTQAALFDRVREAIRELHDYDVPEVIAIPIADGDPDYLGWVSSCVTDD